MFSLESQMAVFVDLFICRLKTDPKSESVTMLPERYCTRGDTMPAGLCEG